MSSECCNSEGLQRSYGLMLKRLTDIVSGVFVPGNTGDRGQTGDWTDPLLLCLLVIHLVFLVLFFCSRSLTSATARE